MEKILIVEDETPILMGLRDNLEMEGYNVLTAQDGETGLEMALEEDPDLVVLDVMLPRMNGFDVLRKLREERIRGAILLLTAKKEETDKIRGLKGGADDYLTKPFSLPELLARIEALLRRIDPLEARLKNFSWDDIHLDFEKYEATRNGEALDLTPREFKIMRLFCENEGRVISRNELLDKVWGYDVFPTTRTVDNHIVKLRKAIEPEPSDPVYITSVRGVGYKFSTEVDEEE